MRILMTGSTGLIGSAITRRLIREHEIVTMGRRPSVDVVVDLSDPAAVAAADFGSIDALVHAAGVIDEDFLEHPERAFRTAVFGANALVDAAVEAGARKLIYVSSAHSYGPFAGLVDELCPPNPMSDYAIAHFATEQVFRRKATDGVVAAALRPCAVFGDLQDVSAFGRWSLIPFSFPREAIIKHTITIKSSGEQRRNFVGTDDVAGCCARWLGIDPGPWTVLNPLGAWDGSVLEFAELCASVSQDLSGQECSITRIPPGGPTCGDDFRYSTISDITRGDQSLVSAMRRLMLNIRSER